MMLLYLSVVANARKDMRASPPRVQEVWAIIDDGKTSFFITLPLALSHPGEGIFTGSSPHPRK